MQNEMNGMTEQEREDMEFQMQLHERMHEQAEQGPGTVTMREVEKILPESWLVFVLENGQKSGRAITNGQRYVCLQDGWETGESPAMDAHLAGHGEARA